MRLWHTIWVPEKHILGFTKNETVNENILKKLILKIYLTDTTLPCKLFEQIGILGVTKLGTVYGREEFQQIGLGGLAPARSE